MDSAVTVADLASWRAHMHIDIFAAAHERDVMHELFPDQARFADDATARGLVVPSEMLPHIELAHYRALGVDPVGERDVEGNMLVTAGLTRLMLLLIGSGATQAYDATHTAIGAGDTNTAAVIGNTDLAAAVNASNRYIQVADGGSPSVSLGVMTVISTFATGNGNFVWNEWVISQNTTSGAVAATAPLLNRKVANPGTKTSASAWAATATMTIA